MTTDHTTPNTHPAADHIMAAIIATLTQAAALGTDATMDYMNRRHDDDLKNYPCARMQLAAIAITQAVADPTGKWFLFLMRDYDDLITALVAPLIDPDEYRVWAYEGKKARQMAEAIRVARKLHDIKDELTGTPNEL